MAKRIADHQIIRESQGLDVSDSEEPLVQKAPAQVLAQRKIIKPRGRANLSLNSASNPPPAAALNPFSFASGAVASLQPGVHAGAASLASEREHKVRALNEKFVETLAALNKANTVANFVPIAKKYIEYYDGLDEGNPAAPKPAVAPVAAAESESESEPEPPKKEIKIQGPAFVLDKKPAVEKSVFGFGKKKPKPADSDSDSDIEIKGPTFLFNQPKTESVFKFNTATKTPAFSFGNGSAAVATEEKKEDKKPAFSFGSSSEPKPAFSFAPKPQEDTPDPSALTESKPEGSAARPAFSFGAKAQDSDNKPAFSFGSKPEASAKSGSLFSFGTSDNKPASNPFGGTDKPAFSFGGSAPKAEEAKSEEPKSAFSFGKLEDSSNKPPVFSFGKLEDSSSKPAFSFGNSEQKPDKPLFSFTKTDTTTAEKPSFSFGQTESKSDAPAAFAFGSKTEDLSKPEKPAFSFGNSESKPFSFGKPENKKEDAPKSLFGSSEKPAFSFGSKTQDTKPAFSLSSDKPAFSFGSSGSMPAFSFGGNNTNSTTSDTAKEDDRPEEVVEEEEVGGDFKPVAQLAPEKVETANNGEEEEETLYTKRAKLMLFDKENKESPYTTKGVGELKVLQHKETKKNRLLIRADGGFRVLLNSIISPDFTYDSIGDGSLVRFPTINPETKLIDTYVLKVKTKDDGKELLDKINELK